MKKFLSLVLTFVILIGCFSVPVSAYEGPIEQGMTRSIKLYDAASRNHRKTFNDILSPYVSVSTFMKDVENAITSCSAEIDITKYNIPAYNYIFNAICDYIFYERPELFNVNYIGYTYWTNTGKMATLKFTYSSFSDTVSEYSNCKQKMISSGAKLLKGIQGNSNLSVEQKLLLLHDRLAVLNEYGYSDTATTIESHTAYGALVNGIAVCQGYAMAYMYLLDRLGIENYYCSSEDLNHAWNIVYVDGVAYHVDVTWDDIGWSNYVNGVEGGVMHDNFLRSSSGIYTTGHEAYDYDTTPTNKKYDSYFWQNSQTEFQLIDNELYYVDNNAESLKRYSDKKTLCSVKATWDADANNYWIGNFTRLSSDGRSLFYSQPKAVYRYDLTTNKSEKIYSTAVFPYDLIYGFTYRDKNLLCDIHNEPPGNSYYGKYELTISYKYKYPFEYGDLSDDGLINNKDLGLLMQYINGWSVDVNTDAADVNADSTVNNKDYGLLMQYVNGWNVSIG